MDLLKKALNSLNMLLVALILGGVILDQWGVVANATVVFANDGVMPVVAREGMALDNNPGFARKISDNNERMLFLADVYTLNFPDIESRVRALPVMSRPVLWWIKVLNYPADGGYNSFSVGDVMRWSGSILFLISLPLLLISIPFQFMAGNLPRKNPLHWFKKAPK